MARLGIERLRSAVLTSRHNQRHSLALTQGAEKGLKHVNGVLLNPRSGAFGKSVRRILKKVLFFPDRKHFPGGQFAEVARAYATSKKSGV